MLNCGESMSVKKSGWLSNLMLFRLLASFFILFGMLVATFSVFRGIREGIDISGDTTKTVSGDPEIKSLPTERILIPMKSVTERTTELISRENLSKREENHHQS
jgi:hypothetical protein